MSAVEHLTQATYLAAAALFIFSLRWLSTPEDGAAGRRSPAWRAWRWPSSARCSIPRSSATRGSSSRWSSARSIGVPLSWVPLTAVPQRTALSHAFGGLAAGLVGTAKYMLWLAGRRADVVPDVRDRRRGAARIPDVHRQPDGGRQAPGSAADAAHHLQEPERLQPRCCSRSRSAAGVYLVREPGDLAAVPGRRRAVARCSACC